MIDTRVSPPERDCFLVHGFRNFWPWSLGSFVLGPVVRLDLCDGEPSCVSHGGWEQKGRGDPKFSSRLSSQ